MHVLLYNVFLNLCIGFSVLQWLLARQLISQLMRLPLPWLLHHSVVSVLLSGMYWTITQLQCYWLLVGFILKLNFRLTVIWFYRFDHWSLPCTRTSVILNSKTCNGDHSDMATTFPCHRRIHIQNSSDKATTRSTRPTTLHPATM